MNTPINPLTQWIQTKQIPSAIISNNAGDVVWGLVCIIQTELLLLYKLYVLRFFEVYVHLLDIIKSHNYDDSPRSGTSNSCYHSSEKQTSRHETLKKKKQIVYIPIASLYNSRLSRWGALRRNRRGNERWEGWGPKYGKR